MTSEGVLGLEQSKWGDLASPDNAVTFPFLRMMAGPVDYTPGAMMNATKADFKPIFNRPMSQGTRCQQLAMYVVYESPLQMLADSPSNYRSEPESLAFLAERAHGVGRDQRAVGREVGEHILVARRSGRDLVRRGDDQLVGCATSRCRCRSSGVLAGARGGGVGSGHLQGRPERGPRCAWTTRARSARSAPPTACASTWRRAAGGWQGSARK